MEFLKTSYRHNSPQRRLFALGGLNEAGWTKVLRLEGYAPGTPRGPLDLQQTLFPYHEASG